MSPSEQALSLESFATFGDLLKYARRRARLTQREVAIAVGYSEAQISRLEQNLRPPDLAALTALFLPALYLEDEPELVARLIELAAQARGEDLHQDGIITFSRSTQKEVLEDVQSVEDHALNNLPLQLTSFVGRESEIAEIINLLSKARLITLTGVGGCGKTRLALETASGLAKSYRDGVWLVELASITDPNLVLQAVASTLGIPESRDDKLTGELIKHLRTREILLILDNCEQVITSAAALADEILRACPQLHILATSREILNIPGEVQFRVPVLSLPDEEFSEDKSPSGSEAVQLFVERAQAVLPSFVVTAEVIPAVAQICRLVDGMPLGIELAAAKMSALSVRQIAARLKDSFQLLSGSRTALPHHRTLEATIQWSYDLLSEEERTVLQRLSVFSGGWTLEAAESVVSDKVLIPPKRVLALLSELVNKSLVIVKWAAEADPRYSMLQVIHQFANEKLRATGNLDQVRARHFDYFFTMAQEGESSLFAVESSLDWAEMEIDNLRAALGWALESDSSGTPSQERTGRGLEMMLHVWPLWLGRGYSKEGAEWLSQLLSVHTAPTPARARGLLTMGDLAGYRRDYTNQAQFIEEALTLARQLGNGHLIASSLMEMGLTVRDRHYLDAVQFLTESLGMFEELNETLWVCRTSFLLAQTYASNGNLAAAKRLWERGLKLSREENDKWQIGWGLEGLGDVERLEGNLERARQLYSESLKLRVEVMDKTGIAYALEDFAQLAAAQAEFKRATVLCSATEQLLQTLNLLLDPARQDLHTALLATARTRLGEDVFMTARAQGKRMKMQETIDYALVPPPND